MSDIYAFYAVVGYFRSSGYFALQKYLKDIQDVKILVGINVDQMFAEAQRKGLLYFGDEEKTKKEFLDWFIQDLKEAKYSKEVEDGILQFIQDLIDGKIEVRAHNSHSIHAKFYIMLPQNHSEHSDGWVIMGSSNLTEAGLGLKKSPNYEMNIALKDFDDVEFAKEEFNELWEKSTPILPADINKFKNKTHIGQTFTPFEIYLKLLIEYFGKNIDYDPDTVGDLPKEYKKLSYQVDAVNQGFRMLMEHNGFFLADVVGLGKTVVAAMIAKRFLIANGSSNTKILVIYPPALEKNWKTTFRLFRIDKYTKFITNGSLNKIVDGTNLNYWPKEDYDLIIVDEAHKYRNHTSQAFGYLQRICKAPRTGEGLIKGKNKKVVLVSATPLNNRPQDLYYQLLLFQDARRSTLPVTNLQSFFGPIIREYKDIIRDENPDIERIRELYNEIREKVISQVTVRRTRRDLKKYPKYLDDLKEEGISFPKIAPLTPIIYDLNPKLSKLFYHTIFYLTDDDKINYYRYQAIRFLKKDLQEEYYDQAVLASKSLAGIMKTLMVKRLESSFFAFKKTLNKLLVFTERMIEMFKNDRVFIAPDLKISELIDKGYSQEEIEELIWKLNEENPKNNIFSADDFEPEFIEGLKRDYNLLTELNNEWEKIDEDPKLEKFFETFDNELFDKDKNPTGLLVIFTESNDTANYLEEKLKEHTKKGILKVSSKNRKRTFEIIQENFDANYHGKQKNEYQILITTDVLSEGINLHRANIIVNYDTPWNATKLIQRMGRINRINGTAEYIYNYIFYPSKEGNEEIRLYQNALTKLQAFHSALGSDTRVFSLEELLEQFELFKEGVPDDEDKRLVYLRFIREFKDNHPVEFKRIKKFPLKARTARENRFVKDENLKNGTIVFLKSPYKMEFYAIDKENKVKALTFLEAAEVFEAKPNEKGFEIPDFHFKQVETALKEFEKDFLGSSSEIITTTDKADAISAQAKKFLRDYKGITSNNNTKKAASALIHLIDKGTYTPLPNEIRKLKRKLDRNQITYGQVDNLIFVIAQKYDAFDNEEEQENNKIEIDVNINPEIIITETFWK